MNKNLYPLNEEVAYENLYNAYIKIAGDHDTAEKANSVINALGLTTTNRINLRGLLGRKEKERRSGKKYKFISKTERKLLDKMPESKDHKTYPISRLLTHPLYSLAGLGINTAGTAAMGLGAGTGALAALPAATVGLGGNALLRETYNRSLLNKIQDKKPGSRFIKRERNLLENIKK